MMIYKFKIFYIILYNFKEKQKILLYLFIKNVLNINSFFIINFYYKHVYINFKIKIFIIYYFSFLKILINK